MFGYIRPFVEDLKVSDYRRYQAVYCGLCHTISNRYGYLARHFLNYDFTFLVMILSDGNKPEMEQKRCPAAPFLGKLTCRSNHAMETAADETIILAYWKLMDNVEDSGFWKGLPVRILMLLIRPAYRKAAGFQPDFDRKVRKCLGDLKVLEREKCSSLDQAADTFARVLKAAALNTGDQRRDRPVEQLLYHVGRWIYLVDAWDDLTEDQAHNRYNPVLLHFSEKTEEADTAMRTTLQHSLNLAASAYGLMDSGCWGNIISNILYLGLPMVEELVFSGKWKQAQKLLPGGRNNNRRIIT